MLITQIAVLMMRLFGLYFFFYVMLGLTSLANDIFDIYKAPADYVTRYEFDLALNLVRLFMQAVAGFCFLVFARPLARLFTKGLDEHPAA